ncbi:MAG: DNA mismatch repair endonuclease MutL, partial [Firmicutes bacterium]|nr:DNA mismatch repair endonuclease MutL [Bacillota bacterium]
MIHILDQDIANKIAAGEVITGPSAVVKELVENAIDAGADRITVEIRAGGKEFIRVSDNGSGIPSEEVELAFEKHATGKIVTEEDLEHIGTLGFRGEALGSIATVSDLEMITRTADESAGTRLIMEQGTVIEKKPVGCEQGTTLTVMHLFYNTPARLKFMKSDRAEAALVSDFLSKAAIAYPEIKFKFISNDRILFNTRGQGDGLAAILTVYGGSLSGKLIPVEAETPDGTMSMRAYMADPMENRPSRKMQIFFVNGRLVHDKTIEDAVAAAYKGRMFAGRYPVIFLFLETTPDKLDVNIHPSKDKIRFYDAEATSIFIRENLLRGLATKELVPHLHIRQEEEKTNDLSPETKPAVNDSPTQKIPLKSTISASEGNVETPVKVQAAPAVTAIPYGRASVQEEVNINAMLADLRAEQKPATVTPEEVVRIDQPFDFDDLTPLGILFDT